MERKITSYSILIVEDDPDFRNLLSEALGIYNHKVTQANNGQEALDILKNNSFNLIFSDITMGGMSGLKFTKKARESGVTVPIIAITGHADRETIEKSLENGISDYMVKPIRIKDLPVVIERNMANQDCDKS